MNQRVIVVGGGAAGLMAAGRAAESGASVLLLEKGSRLGRKLLLTGNRHCNLTNIASAHTFISHLGPTGAFMHNALARFGAQALCQFFHSRGVLTVVEAQGRVFPTSARAQDVLDALVGYCDTGGVEIRLDMPVAGLSAADGRVNGVVVEGGAHIPADAVIMATGGASWGQIGSTGEGYAMLAQLGHTITDLYPGLVPLVATEGWVKALEGLSFAGVVVTVYADGKRILRQTGDLLFTRDGLSGPLILDMSSRLAPLLARQPLHLFIDYLPGHSLDALYALCQGAQGSRPVDLAFLRSILPRRLIQQVSSLVSGSTSGPSHNTATDQSHRPLPLSMRQQRAAAELVKRFPLTITGTRSWREAMVTVGGVACSEVDPVTFCSQRVANLYITGELLDLAGDSGGYNLQTAFTSGWLAGKHAAEAGA